MSHAWQENVWAHVRLGTWACACYIPVVSGGCGAEHACASPVVLTSPCLSPSHPQPALPGAPLQNEELLGIRVTVRPPCGRGQEPKRAA